MSASFEGAAGRHFGGTKVETMKILSGVSSEVLVTEDGTVALATAERLLSGATVAIEETSGNLLEDGYQGGQEIKEELCEMGLKLV